MGVISQGARALDHPPADGGRGAVGCACLRRHHPEHHLDFQPGIDWRLVYHHGHRLHGPVERFTASTFALTGSMRTARTFQTATLLNSGSVAGQVLVTGGFRVGPLASAEIFNPISATFRATDAMHLARLVHTATRLIGGEVLIAGGEDNQGGHALAPAELL